MGEGKKIACTFSPFLFSKSYKKGSSRSNCRVKVRKYINTSGFPKIDLTFFLWILLKYISGNCSLYLVFRNPCEMQELGQSLWGSGEGGGAVVEEGPMEAHCNGCRCW